MSPRRICFVQYHYHYLSLSTFYVVIYPISIHNLFFIYACVMCRPESESCDIFPQYFRECACHFSVRFHEWQNHKNIRFFFYFDWIERDIFTCTHNTIVMYCNHFSTHSPTFVLIPDAEQRFSASIERNVIIWCWCDDIHITYTIYICIACSARCGSNRKIQLTINQLKCI